MYLSSSSNGHVSEKMVLSVWGRVKEGENLREAEIRASAWATCGRATRGRLRFVHGHGLPAGGLPAGGSDPCMGMGYLREGEIRTSAWATCGTRVWVGWRKEGENLREGEIRASAWATCGRATRGRLRSVHRHGLPAGG